MRDRRCKNCVYRDEPAMCPDDCEVKHEILKKMDTRSSLRKILRLIKTGMLFEMRHGSYKRLG